MNKLTKKDICIITPTYNRPEDIELTIKSLIKYKNIPGKHIILDQSKNKKTKKVFEKYKRCPALQYNHYNKAGMSLVLNDGIKEALKENYKIICIQADDVEVRKDVLSIALKEFNSDEKIKGIGSIQLEQLEDNSIRRKLKSKIFKFFLLPSISNTFEITGPYGNNSITTTEEDSRDCQWLPGFLTFYKSEVFKDYRIPERTGYDVLEDIDLGYYSYTKYGKGSLIIPKDMRVYHHMSKVERYPNKKRIFVNHEDHMTFYYRYFYNIKGTIKLFWEIFWINILNIGRTLLKPNKENFLKLIYLWQALSYCIKYRKKIKAGKSRMFLNQNLSFNENW